MNYGRYEIIKELGKGTMGVVYQAHDPDIDRRVALKILRQDRVGSEEFVNRFLKEAKAIGRLSHPNIVTVFDVGKDHDTIYIAMEYLEGMPFNQVIRSGKMPVPRIIDIGIQVAATLDYAHKKGIIHRDIKPSNMILTEDGQVKLTDFGIAHIEDTDMTQQTQTGEILGTPVYMSPEQVMGKVVDGRSDLYSLGVILYELLVEKRPFTGNSLAAIFKSITSDEAKPPKEIDPFISTRLSNIILKLLSKNPENRYQDGETLVRKLRTLLEDNFSQTQVVDVQKKMPLWLFWWGSGLLLIGVIVGLWILGKNKPVPAVNRSVQSIRVPVDREPLLSEQSVLNVSSVPSGAQIFINNQYKGNTPIRFELPFGKYEVRASLPHYLDWEAQISLEDPEEIPLHVDLMPLK